MKVPASSAAADRGASPLRRSILVPLGVVALIAAHLALGNAGSWRKSAAFDENAHIGSGFSFWATQDFRLGPEAVLTQRWLALPVYLSGARPPSPQSAAWLRIDSWHYSSELLYRDGTDGRRLLRLARAANSLLSALVGLTTYLWARALFGSAGGIVALALYALLPTTLAHAGLATPDISAALAITASMAALWRVVHRISPASLALSCLAVGLAFCTKSSSVLLLPMGLLAAAVRICVGKPLEIRAGRRRRVITNRAGQTAAIAGLVAVHVLAASVLVWGMFNFRYESGRVDAAGASEPMHGVWSEAIARMQAPQPWDTALRNRSLARAVEFARQHRLLPEAYLLAQAGAVASVSKRNSFLDGRFSPVGFAAFYPACVLYKTPLAVFLLLIPVFSLLGASRLQRAPAPGAQRPDGPWRGGYGTVPLWCLLAVYWGAAVASNLNIGIRHIIPTFPATFILMGAGGRWFSRTAPAASPGFRRLQRLLLAGGLLWLLVETLHAFPHYLAYFNGAAGGPQNGYRRLVDSSLDWGQDLPGLAQWLERNVRQRPDPPRVYASYFGSTPPSVHGVRATWLPSFFPIAETDPSQPRAAEAELEPGIYCISATMLQCVYNQPYAGPWRVDYESNYRELNRLVQLSLANRADPVALAAELRRVGLPDWNSVVRRFEAARFGRLCAHLRQRPPDDQVNHSIMIYTLSKDELRRALHGPPAEAHPLPARSSDPLPYFVSNP